MENPIKSHETSIFLWFPMVFHWFSYGLHLVFRLTPPDRTVSSTELSHTWRNQQAAQDRRQTRQHLGAEKFGDGDFVEKLHSWNSTVERYCILVTGKMLIVFPHINLDKVDILLKRFSDSVSGDYSLGTGGNKTIHVPHDFHTQSQQAYMEIMFTTQPIQSININHTFTSSLHPWAQMVPTKTLGLATGTNYPTNHSTQFPIKMQWVEKSAKFFAETLPAVSAAVGGCFRWRHLPGTGHPHGASPGGKNENAKPGAVANMASHWRWNLR